jgi:hypothetical protein
LRRADRGITGQLSAECDDVGRALRVTTCRDQRGDQEVIEAEVSVRNRNALTGRFWCARVDMPSAFAR